MRLAFFAAALAGLLTATGCSSATPPSASTPGAGDQPQPGGRVSLRWAADPSDWDITRGGYCNTCTPAIALAYSSLLGQDEQLKLMPELAQSWDLSPDATAFTFHLRSGLKFANLPPVNGRDLTATDVKFSYEYLTRTGEFAGRKDLPAYVYVWMFEGMDSVAASDPSTVTVRFKKPFAPFLSYAASADNAIMAREIYDADGSFSNQMVGSGPFQLDVPGRQRGSRLVFKKNPTYFEPGKPYLDELQYLIISDPSTMIAAFQTKQLDILDARSSESAASIVRGVPQAQSSEDLAPSPSHMYMNTRTGPLSDVRVRRAISLGLNRDEFLQVLFQGKGGWALAGAFQDTYTQAEVKQILKYDPEAAKKLLAEAGYASGLDLELNYAQDGNPDTYLTEAQLLQAQMKKVGINLTFKITDRPTYLERRRKGEFVINTTGKAVQGDVDSYLYAVFYSTSSANYGGVKDPALDKLIDAQRQEPAPAKRQELVRQAVRLIADQAWQLALYTPPVFTYWQPHVRDYVSGADDFRLLSTWIKK